MATLTEIVRQLVAGKRVWSSTEEETWGTDYELAALDIQPAWETGDLPERFRLTVGPTPADLTFAELLYADGDRAPKRHPNGFHYVAFSRSAARVWLLGTPEAESNDLLIATAPWDGAM